MKYLLLMLLLAGCVTTANNPNRKTSGERAVDRSSRDF